MNGFYLAIGKQGSGKTLFITKLLVDNKDKGKKIFSNYSLYGIKYNKITLNPNIKNTSKNKKVIYILDALDKNPNYFDNSIILIDELHLDLNSLDFFKKNARRLDTFFSQLRKRNILLLGTTQYLMNVNVRIRRQCKNVFEMKHLKSSVFEVKTFEIDGYYQEEVSTYLVDLGGYYHYYDTNEIVL